MNVYDEPAWLVETSEHQRRIRVHGYTEREAMRDAACRAAVKAAGGGDAVQLRWAGMTEGGSSHTYEVFVGRRNRHGGWDGRNVFVQVYGRERVT